MFATILTYVFWVWDWLIYLLTLPMFVFLINVGICGLLNFVTDWLFPVVFRWTTTAEHVEFPVLKRFYDLCKKTTMQDSDTYNGMLEYSIKLMTIYMALFAPAIYLHKHDMYYLPKLPWIVTFSLKQMLMVSNLVGTFKSIKRDERNASSIQPAFELEGLIAMHTIGFNVYVLPLLIKVFSL